MFCKFLWVYCLKTDHCNEGKLHFTFVLQSFRSIVATSEVYIDFLLNRDRRVLGVNGRFYSL